MKSAARIGFTVALLLGTQPLACLAQAAKASPHGAYSGEFTVSATDAKPQLTYRASGKLTLPVTERGADSASAEFFSGEGPPAMVRIEQWDSAWKGEVPESDGKMSSWKCSLATPVEIPMTATGVLNVNLKKKTHALSVTLLSTKGVAMNCVHSRSGAYKKKQGITLYLGTGVPGQHYEKQLPFADAAKLAASYALNVSAASPGRGPIAQTWDLKLAR
jgi:hypothetical protein